MKTLKLIALATLLTGLAAAPACKKKEKTEPAPTQGTGTGTAMTPPPPPDPTAGTGAGTAADPGAAADPAAAGDFIAVYAEHAPDKKPDDPVEVKFEKFKVVKADFDPEKIEGGTATIEVDLASLKSGSDKRDAHLNTPDYLDTSKFTTMTIDVGNVKKKDDKTFTADAKIKLRDVEKTYPVTFEVVEKGPDWIKVKGEHKFARLDFKVGKEKLGPDEAVSQELTAKLQLTLKKS
jgi:polyisoprenoid-binding protein YceI